MIPSSHHNLRHGAAPSLQHGSKTASSGLHFLGGGSTIGIWNAMAGKGQSEAVVRRRSLQLWYGDGPAGSQTVIALPCGEEVAVSRAGESNMMDRGMAPKEGFGVLHGGETPLS